MPKNWKIGLMILFFLILIPVGIGFTQDPAGKKPLTYDAYDSWRSIQDTVLSRDGVWLAYALVAQEGDGELVVRNLQTDRETRFPRGRNPLITPDGRFLIYRIVPLQSDLDKAKKEKKKDEEKPKDGLGIIDLASGKQDMFERVKNFQIPEEGNGWVAFLMEKKVPPKDEKKEEKKVEPTVPGEKGKAKKEKPKDPGTDLQIRRLETGETKLIPEVTGFAWNRPGTLLAYTVSSEKPEQDGCFLWKGANGEATALLTGLGHYQSPVFARDVDLMAFLSDRDDYPADHPQFKLYFWNGKDPARELAARNTPGIRTGWAVSANGKLEFSRDGSRLFFGTAPTPKPEPEDQETVKVDIWNWQDPLLQTIQKVQAETEAKRSYRAVCQLRSGKIVPLATPEIPEIVLSHEGDRVLGSSDVPYRPLASWDTEYKDYYLIDLQTGAAKRVLEKRRSQATFSPGGRYLLYFTETDGHWYTYRIADGHTVDLTTSLTVSFSQEDWDTPDLAAAYGTAGWLEKDRAVLIYDRFDIWRMDPDGGSAVNLTRGRDHNRINRYLRLDPEEKAIPDGQPLLLQVTDDRTKASGLARLEAGGAMKSLLFLEKQVGRPLKSKQADRFVFTQQRFEEFPDLWVSDGTFTSPRQISHANPQQDNYRWGRAELIDYVNADGTLLQAILIKPDDFDPTRKYPLMVYIYEKLSDGLHRYVAPAPGNNVNAARYVSNGYVILMPDIIYKTGFPGQSALKCVVPAVQKVIAMGFVDPARIGIQGHSWGGYQISYLITQTGLFRAVEAGASVVNMLSAYGGIRWETGMSRAWQYEKSQSRIGAPLWTRPLQFIENSPIFWVEKVNTPYLTMHNDEDGAVPWYQGIEFFSALRRLGKEAYMFNYNGEKHGLRQRDNQKHWTVHLDEFFDHFLKGTARPEWMSKGVSYLERGKRDVSTLYKRPDTNAK